MTFLTSHFTLSEFLVSAMYPSLARTQPVSPIVVQRLSAWCWHIGEPIRRTLGAPVIITSGYRGPDLNRKVGGSGSSQHMTGEGVDFIVRGEKSRDVYNFVVSHLTPFQIILYQDRDGGDRHLHASVYPARVGPRPLRARHQGGKLIALTEGFRFA
jgi:hypothetical protein